MQCFFARICCGDDVCHLCFKFVRMLAIVVGVCFGCLLTLEEFVGIFYRSVRSAEVFDCYNTGSYCVVCFWHAIICGIRLDSAVFTIFLPLHKVSVWCKSSVLADSAQFKE